MIKKLKYEDVLYISENMREADRKEIFATRANSSFARLATDCMCLGDIGWTIHKDNPVCAIGAYPLWPGVWRAWMFATDEFPSVSVFTTKFVKHIMRPTIEQKAHRLECNTIEGHVDAHKWLELLGAKKECFLHQYGKNKENFYTYVWRN